MLKEGAATADFRSEMPHFAWVRFTRVASVAGLGVFASVIAFAQPSSGLETFFDTWIYGPTDHYDYLERVGVRRLFGLNEF